MGSVNTLIPEGVWYDFFTGLKYRGGRMMELYRPIDTIPVLAKAGAIIPMQAQEELSSRTDNPVSMELRIFAGADGTFTLYEDDGVSMEYENGKYCTTDYVLQWGAEKVFNILPAQGVVSLIPEIRRYTVLIYGVKEDCITRIVQNGTEISYTGEYDEKRNVLTIQLSGIPVTDRITICFRNGEILSENNILEHAYEILNRSQIPFATKEKVYRLLQSGQEPACILSTIQAMVMPDCMKTAISELLLA
jgi:hypothetical protein